MGASRKSYCGLKALALTVCAAVGMVVGLAGEDRATAYTWSSTSGGNWNDATWTNIGYPNAAGDTATISQNITADQILHIKVGDATVGYTFTSVPEPGSLGLLVLGIPMLLRRRKH